MTFLFAAWLGIVQGLTEFLPVSSSAHLILGRALLGWDAGRLGLVFDVACHVGTLGAVALYFRAELAAMAAAVPRLLGGATDPASRMLLLITIGTVPVVIVGVVFEDLVETSLRTPFVAAAALLAGAVLLLAAERVARQRRTEASLSLPDALVLGAAQAAALVPGVSRSGSTIAIGLLLGLRRDAAARFAFLLSVPAVLAAAAKESFALGEISLSSEVVLLFLIGMVTSGVVGYLAVKYLVRYLVRHTLDVFAYYRIALSALTFVWLLT